MIDSRYGGIVAFASKHGLSWPEVSRGVQGDPVNAKVRRALEAEFKLPWERLRQPILSVVAELAAREGSGQ